MTRSPRDARPVAQRPRDPRTPRSPLVTGAPIAVILSIVGLVVVAMGTLTLGSGNLPFSIGGGTTPGGGGGGGGGAAQTVLPSNIVVVPTEKPGIKVPGTLVYAKAGNIWVQSNGQATQLTNGGTDSMPSFSPDGATVYFVRTRDVRGLWPIQGNLAFYQMNVPTLMAVPTAGGNPRKILDGLIDPGGPRKWMAFIREPVLSPNGRTMAIASDLPDPTRTDVTIKLYDLKTGKLTDPRLAQVSPLGHQDPAWRPDGKLLLYVYNNRDGAKGAPQIYAYNPATGKTRPVTTPGYLHPSWSPDGQYFAATRTSAFGTDVVILNASTGAQVAQLTNDGESWAPAWSPAGDEIAYLHVSGQVVDLRMVQLTGSAPTWTVSDPINLTQDSGLDSVSRPDWFVPADQLPAATPAPSVPTAPPPTASPSPS
jgi:Tol biopolymer transport system component